MDAKTRYDKESNDGGMTRKYILAERCATDVQCIENIG